MKYFFAVVVLFVSSQIAVAVEPAKQVMDATFKIFNPKSTSTSFLVQGKGEDAPIFLVTTAHTLERMQGDSALLVLRKPKEDGTFTRLDHKVITRKDGKPVWVKHEKHDVAVLKLTGELPVKVTPLKFDHLADAKKLADSGVEICSNLFLFAYPERFEANSAGFPIARQGIFASPPLLPANTYPTFLADYTTFAGDSGGPVFVTANGKSPLIVGIVLGQYNHDEKIQTVYENRLVKHPFRLGMILHAQYVLETLDQAMKMPLAN